MPNEVRRPWIEPIILEHGWPGWFSKIELFRRNLFKGPVFYLDLDTVIVENIDDMVFDHKFTVLKNFWHAGKIGSGLMAWDADLSLIYRRFEPFASTMIARYKEPRRLGDQAFIEEETPVAMEYWQELYPHRVVSYRKHCMPIKRVPEGASIVCFGGAHRPWTSDIGRSVHAAYA